MKKQVLICTLLFILFTKSALSQITITTGLSAQQITDAICGTAVTTAAVSDSRQAKTPAQQVGTYTCGAAYQIAIKSGVLITTGAATKLGTGGNASASSSDRGYTAGLCSGSVSSTDADLSVLNGGGSLYDMYKLQFDIVNVNFDTLVLSYAYGSEEYTEFVGSSFTDAFGFFLKGNEYPSFTNFAWVPGTLNVPITVNTINPSTNSSLYNDNPTGAAVSKVEYDGYTKAIQAKIKVTRGKTYTVKIALADCTDGCLDTGIFIQTATISTNSTTLPIELLEFAAKQDNTRRRNTIKWKTATEKNNSHFEILRKAADGSSEVIGKVNGNGTSNLIHSYEFIDNHPADGINYYQLKQIDFDGKFETSKIIAVDNRISVDVHDIAPNPVTTSFTAVVELPENEQYSDAKAEIIDITGKTIFSQALSIQAGTNAITVNTEDLMPGSYFFRIVAGSYTSKPIRIAK